MSRRFIGATPSGGWSKRSRPVVSSTGKSVGGSGLSAAAARCAAARALSTVAFTFHLARTGTKSSAAVASASTRDASAASRDASTGDPAEALAGAADADAGGAAADAGGATPSAPIGRARRGV